MTRTFLVAVLCTTFGVWFGAASERLISAEQRTADLRMVKAAVDRCSIRWRKT